MAAEGFFGVSVVTSGLPLYENVPTEVVAALNCRGTLMGLLPVLAVKVTVCAVDTVDILAVNSAAVAFACTVTVAGTVTAALLLVRLTLTAPLGDPEVNFTVQISVPAPFGGLSVDQSNALNAAVAGPVVAPTAIELCAVTGM